MGDVNVKALQAEFLDCEIKWRVDGVGRNREGNIWCRVVPYVDARIIQDRLDGVVGPGGWQSRYTEFKAGFVCEIGIRFGDDWIWKAGGAGPTEYEPYKGGLSGSEKRAASAWGVGRYLHGMTRFAVTHEQTRDNAVDLTRQGRKEGWERTCTTIKGRGNQSDERVTFWWERPRLENS